MSLTLPLSLLLSMVNSPPPAVFVAWHGLDSVARPAVRHGQPLVARSGVTRGPAWLPSSSARVLGCPTRVRGSLARGQSSARARDSLARAPDAATRASCVAPAWRAPTPAHVAMSCSRHAIVARVSASRHSPSALFMC